MQLLMRNYFIKIKILKIYPILIYNYIYVYLSVILNIKKYLYLI